MRAVVGARRVQFNRELYARTGAEPYVLRELEQIAGFFDGLELVPPGLVDVQQWRPESSPDLAPNVGTAPGSDLPHLADSPLRVLP